MEYKKKKEKEKVLLIATKSITFPLCWETDATFGEPVVQKFKVAVLIVFDCSIVRNERYRSGSCNLQLKTSPNLERLNPKDKS